VLCEKHAFAKVVTLSDQTFSRRLEGLGHLRCDKMFHKCPSTTQLRKLRFRPRKSKDRFGRYFTNFTLAGRMLTSPPASGSGACNGLNPRARRNSSSLRMAPSLNTSVRVGIGLQRPPIGKSSATDSSSGERSLLPLWPHSTCAELILLSLCPVLSLASIS
jgi:hypothetical protein